MLFEELPILSPKRNRRLQRGWEGFFPYYAGFPEAFARGILENAGLSMGAAVLDPWNGSGTTTFTAAHLGYKAIGLDLNPVMVIVSRARTLPFSEIDALLPLGKDIVKSSRQREKDALSDPLLVWFDKETASSIRSIERCIRTKLVGSRTKASDKTDLQKLSSIAAGFYVALFAVCRELTRAFQSSNPTWLRFAKPDENRVSADRRFIEERFHSHIQAMAAVLADGSKPTSIEHLPIEIRIADSTSPNLTAGSVDLVLTSPPYCTRIDYTAATRIELAVIFPLVSSDSIELSRSMIGSTRVPKTKIAISKDWGRTCKAFLRKVERHPSKASAGYYLNTHLDYFDKMSKSISIISHCLRNDGAAILVVQDSFYKEVHNDLPTILTEIADAHGLALARRDDFHVSRSMSGINPNTKNYNRRPGALESVLCFRK